MIIYQRHMAECPYLPSFQIDPMPMIISVLVQYVLSHKLDTLREEKTQIAHLFFFFSSREQWESFLEKM